MTCEMMMTFTWCSFSANNTNERINNWNQSNERLRLSLLFKYRDTLHTDLCSLSFIQTFGAHRLCEHWVFRLFWCCVSSRKIQSEHKHTYIQGQTRVATLFKHNNWSLMWSQRVPRWTFLIFEIYWNNYIKSYCWVTTIPLFKVRGLPRQPGMCITICQLQIDAWTMGSVHTWM